MSKLIIPPELIKRISEERCVAYIGAGLSVGAGLPTWPQLIERMVGWCEKNGVILPKKSELGNLFRKNEFLTLGNILFERLTEDQFQRFMTGEFQKTGLIPTEAHNLLTQIPFRAVFTSNYDQLVESAYIVEKKGTAVPVFTHLDVSELSQALRSDEFYVLKTHGDINSINSIVFTRTQYRELMFANPAYKKHLENVLISNSFLFMGFSLTDPDLLTILDELQVVFKSNTTTHYALFNKKQITSIEIERFRKDYSIEIIPYTPSDGSHPEVLEFLREITQRTPKKFLRHLEIAKQESEDLDANFRLVSNTKGEFHIEEKYPGAAEKGNLDFSLTIKREAFDAWQKLEDTGEETTIPGELVDNIKFPEILRRAFGDNFKTTEIKIGTYPTNEKTSVRLKIVSTDGQSETLDHIELMRKSGGKKEAILSNEKQDHILKVTLTLNFDSEEINISLHGLYSGINVSQSLVLDNFFEAVEKGGEIFIEFSDTGLPLGHSSIPQKTFRSQDPFWKKIVRSLVFIQEKSGVTFETPEIVNDDDIKAIEDTALILKQGWATGSLTFEVGVPRELAERMATGSGTVDITHTADHRPVILGKTVLLGTVWISCEKMVLTRDEKDKVATLLQEHPEGVTFPCKVTSSEDSQSVVYYPDWLQDQEFETLFQNARYRETSFRELVNILFEVARMEDDGTNIEKVVSLFETAKAQQNEYGRPYNMLGRYETQELEKVLSPHLKKMGRKAVSLVNQLEKSGTISKKDKIYLLNGLKV